MKEHCRIADEIRRSGSQADKRGSDRTEAALSRRRRAQAGSRSDAPLLRQEVSRPEAFSLSDRRRPREATNLGDRGVTWCLG